MAPACAPAGAFASTATVQVTALSLDEVTALNCISCAAPRPAHTGSIATATVLAAGGAGAAPMDIVCWAPVESFHCSVKFPELSAVKVIELTGFWLDATLTYGVTRS